MSGVEQKDGVSVVICCYNSCDVLTETLRHMSLQRVPAEVNWEVILIDNASTDGTGEMALKYWDSLDTGIQFRVVIENEPGLSFARKRGVYSAKYATLVFCDDDNWFAPDYVVSAYQRMKDPAIGICGGQGIAVTDGEFPDWFERNKSAYAVGHQNEKEGLVQRYLCGAGITMRRTVLKTAYDLGFDTVLTGRKGDSLTAGEDGELAEWVAIFGCDNWYYDPNMKFKHFIKQNRLTFSHLLKLKSGFGKSEPILRLYQMARKGQIETYRGTWSYQLLRSIGVFLVSLIVSPGKDGPRVCYHRRIPSVLWLLGNRQTFYERKKSILSMRKIASNSGNA